MHTYASLHPKAHMAWSACLWTGMVSYEPQWPPFPAYGPLCSHVPCTWHNMRHFCQLCPPIGLHGPLCIPDPHMATYLSLLLPNATLRTLMAPRSSQWHHWPLYVQFMVPKWQTYGPIWAVYCPLWHIWALDWLTPMSPLNAYGYTVWPYDSLFPLCYPMSITWPL